MSALKDRGNKSSSACFLKQRRSVTVTSLLNVSKLSTQNQYFYNIW